MSRTETGTGVAERPQAPKPAVRGPARPRPPLSREIVETRFIWVMIGIGVIVGLFAGAAASGQTLTFLAWNKRTGFGVTDPQFGIDASFYAFSLPWWRLVLSFVFTILARSIVRMPSSLLIFSSNSTGVSGESPVEKSGSATRT